MFNREEYKSIINIPLAVIIASSIIIIITTGKNDENALNGLLRGYLGLGIGVLFLIILNLPPKNFVSLIPFIMIIGIISLTIFYLYTYFDTISKGDVSGYYKSLSTWSIIFLAIQFMILFSSMFDKSEEINDNIVLTNKTVSFLSLIGVINYLIVITIGVVLKFYSTQG